MDRIVDIETDGRHLAAFRGFLVVSEDSNEVGRVPLDDILGVIVHAHGITYSNNLLVALAARNAVLVICTPNHAPTACVWPLSGHHAQGARIQAQIEMTRPFRKQAWRQIVVSKIRMQQAVLEASGQSPGMFEILARKVRSGDPDNVEAQVARRYWPMLMGRDFRRDTAAGGVNALLNYGYTVLRAATMRAVAGAGLHPTLGVHHANRSNSFALADDLIEPYRPLVDQVVRGLVTAGADDLTTGAKRELVRLIAWDLPTDDGRTPVSVSLQRLATSFAQSCLARELALVLPTPPPPIELAQLGRA